MTQDKALRLTERQKDIESLLLRAKEELETVISTDLLAINTTLKIHLAVFSYLLCVVLDQIWKFIYLYHDKEVKGCNYYYPCITDFKRNKTKDIEAHMLEAGLQKNSEVWNIIKASQPYLEKDGNKQWLKHLRYFRNFNTHDALSSTIIEAELDIFTTELITKVRGVYKDRNGNIINMDGRDVSFWKFLENVDNIAEVVFKNCPYR